MTESTAALDDAVLATAPFGIDAGSFAPAPEAEPRRADLAAEPAVPGVQDDRPTVTEIAESLTGWDEIAIETHIAKLSELSNTMSERALAFVLHRRMANPDGTRTYTDAEAKRVVFDLPLKAVRALFRPEPEGGAEEGKA